MIHELQKKAYYPVSPELAEYLSAFRRASELPVTYKDMLRYSALYPLFDNDGNDTLWKTVHYDAPIRDKLYDGLTCTYSVLKTGGTKVRKHLKIERVDFCDFGNSRPFRVRVVNQYNDNYDHFYVKIADASRLYGLELEHILSPNRINFIVHGETLIEEHIAGVPGDYFIDHYFQRSETNRVRVAKEFVKFNERSFIRLLGDMRSYNYVVDITPDFEETQYRVRAIDFDQQSYEGNKEMYLPQFFKENEKVVELCTTLLNYPTMQQYQDEERTLIHQRVILAKRRLDALFETMCQDELSPPEKVDQLRHELNEYHHTNRFDDCEGMGDLVRTNIDVTLDKLE